MRRTKPRSQLHFVLDRMVPLDRVGVGVELASGTPNLVSWLVGQDSYETRVYVVDSDVRRFGSTSCSDASRGDRIVGDVFALPIESNSVDLVVWRKLFCVLKRPKVALKEVLRVVRPGGRVVAIEPAGPQQFYAPNNERFQELSGQINDAFRRGWRERGADQDIGLRMGELFTTAGLVKIKVDAVVEAYMLGDCRRTHQDVSQQLQVEASRFPEATERLLRRGGLSRSCRDEHLQLAEKRLKTFRERGKEEGCERLAYVRVQSPLIVVHGMKSGKG